MKPCIENTNQRIFRVCRDFSVSNKILFLCAVDSTIANAVVEGLKPVCGTVQINNATYEEFYLPKSISIIRQ